MPTVTKDYTVNTTYNLEMWTIPLDLHFVKAVTVFDLTESTYIGDTFVTIGLLAGGTTIQNQVCALASGYCGRINPVFWTGSLPVDHDWYLYAQVHGIADDQLRLSALVWKIVSDERNEFRVDP